VRVYEVDAGVELKRSLGGQFQDTSSEPFDVALEACGIDVAELNGQ